MSKEKVWFVTGASQGLGLSLVQHLLQQGYRVAATSRNLQHLTSEVKADPSVFLPIAVDLPNEKSVRESIDKTISAFGRIDVAVNNAGYGLSGSLEELTDEEARENFNVNVFGSLNVIRQLLPVMRRQASGHIINIASIGGFNGLFPGFGIYCATKFAMTGFTEGLFTEAKPLGINATVVSPGYFRTNFLAAGSFRTPARPLDAYQTVRKALTFHQDEIDGNQPGDPDKAADAIIAIAESENPPLHLFLGQDAYNLAYEKIELLKNDMEKWRDLATATGF